MILVKPWPPDQGDDFFEHVLDRVALDGVLLLAERQPLTINIGCDGAEIRTLELRDEVHGSVGPLLKRHGMRRRPAEQKGGGGNRELHANLNTHTRPA